MIGVFTAYSHDDEELHRELVTHLALMRRQKTIDVWYDRLISPGTDLDLTISKKFEDCQIILLLVSSYFLNSDYCYDVEMERAIKRHRERSARVIPIILRLCDWKSAPFGRLKVLPKDGKAVTTYNDRHEAFREVAEGTEK